MSSLKVVRRTPTAFTETGRSDAVGASSVRVIRGGRITDAGVTAGTTVVGISRYSRRHRQGTAEAGFPACDADLSATTCLPCREGISGAGLKAPATYL